VNISDQSLECLHHHSPILNRKPSHAAKLVRVAGDDCPTPAHSDACDLRVVRSDDPATLFQIVPNPCRSFSGFVVKWSRRVLAEELGKKTQPLRWFFIAKRPVQKLFFHHEHIQT
jgi:hypothetical protein